jgi:alpha-tubulin suppressor-like RCC1 family protein
MSNSTIYCWGLNTSYQIGNNSTTAAKKPTATSALNMTPAAINLMNITSCAFANINRLKCWGSGNNGAAGYGNTNPIPTPTSTFVDL